MTKMLLMTGLLLLLIGELYVRLCVNEYEHRFEPELGLLTAQPQTAGDYKTRATSGGNFQINAEGWNSIHEFSSERTGNKQRIAVVGHSNTEGLRVPIEQTWPVRLEAELEQKTVQSEVYPFALSSVHLAQALHISRYVISKFKPDRLLVATSGSEFMAETTRFPYYLSLRVKEESGVEEVPPENTGIFGEFSPKPLRALYASKLIKRMDERWELGNWFMDKLGPNTDTESDQIPTHLLKMCEPSYRKRNFKGQEYLLTQFKQLADESGTQLVFVLMPVEYASHNTQWEFPCPDKEVTVQELRNQFKTQLSEQDLEVIDLQTAFDSDFQVNQIPFDFPGDGHFNAHANDLLGKTIADEWIEKPKQRTEVNR